MHIYEYIIKLDVVQVALYVYIRIPTPMQVICITSPVSDPLINILCTVRVRTYLANKNNHVYNSGHIIMMYVIKMPTASQAGEQWVL